MTNDKQELERELTQRVQILAPLPDAGPWERFKTTSTHWFCLRLHEPFLQLLGKGLTETLTGHNSGDRELEITRVFLYDLWTKISEPPG